MLLSLVSTLYHLTAVNADTNTNTRTNLNLQTTLILTDLCNVVIGLTKNRVTVPMVNSGQKCTNSRVIEETFPPVKLCQK
jgi:hypothetical protein